MLRILLIVVAFGSALLNLIGAAVAADKATVALTTTTNPAVADGGHKLSGSLAALLEVQLFADDGLSIVERQQIELALQELALSRSRSAADSLQLGKLVTADMLVMLELRQPDDKSAKPFAMLRVVEAKTAAIRGITVATDVEESSVEDVAEQFARYVSSVIREPQAPIITVAVAPFESVGRFDRLRPLELGIRDLVTARLLSTVVPSLRRRDGAERAGQQDPPKQQPVPSAERRDYSTPPFQVLQRSNLDQLLREMDLIQSGFADKTLLPQTLPNRQAAFLIKGEIDERQVDGKFTIVVRGELRHAASAKVRASFEFECLPTELEDQLTVRVDELAKHLGVADASRLRTDVGGADKKSEADSLKSLAFRDLYRFWRLCPIDHGHRAFALTMQSAGRDIAIAARPNTPLGMALLRKSIDRLETVLFIHPDDAQAACGLGFCFAIHQPGIYHPERADELLRKAASLQPQSELAALALAFLSELAFDDQTGRFDPHPKGSVQNPQTLQAARDAAAERLWLAFEKTPIEFRDRRWPRILVLFAQLQRSPEQDAALLEKVIPITEQADAKHRQQLASEVKTLAIRLSSQSLKKPDLKAIAIDSLRRWADGTDAELADFGRQGLATICEANSDFLDAAKLYEASAAILAEATSAQDRHRRDGQLVKAAKNYRLAKQPDRGLQLLQSFEPNTSPGSILDGSHGYEIAFCYEALGERKKALATYIRAAEVCPGIVPNSDLVERVIKLGGVPLREDRDVDVKYVTRKVNQPLSTTALATDGHRLFLDGVVPVKPSSPTSDKTENGRQIFGGVGVAAFDPDSGTWQSLNTDLEVTCLKIRDRELWVGTYDRGLWRYELDAKKWTSFGTDQGLPDLHVESIAFRANDVFVGVGSAAAGGLIRLDGLGKVHLFNEPQAPSVVPTHLVVTDKELLARTLRTIHKWSWESKSWTTQTNTSSGSSGIAWRLFAGTNGIWASSYGRELTRWEADKETNEFFKPAWYFVPGTKSGYQLNFVTERGDEVWFGGGQWDLFNSSGLYRIHLKTGAFHKFTPADGFKTTYEHGIFDGLWLGDRLWLATSQGLCVVTPRDGLPPRVRVVPTREMP